MASIEEGSTLFRYLVASSEPPSKTIMRSQTSHFHISVPQELYIIWKNAMSSQCFRNSSNETK